MCTHKVFFESHCIQNGQKEFDHFECNGDLQSGLEPCFAQATDMESHNTKIKAINAYNDSTRAPAL